MFGKQVHLLLLVSFEIVCLWKTVKGENITRKNDGLPTSLFTTTDHPGAPSESNNITSTDIETNSDDESYFKMELANREESAQKRIAFRSDGVYAEDLMAGLGRDFPGVQGDEEFKAHHTRFNLQPDGHKNEEFDPHGGEEDSSTNEHQLDNGEGESLLRSRVLYRREHKVDDHEAYHGYPDEHGAGYVLDKYIAGVEVGEPYVVGHKRTFTSGYGGGHKGGHGGGHGKGYGGGHKGGYASGHKVGHASGHKHRHGGGYGRGLQESNLHSSKGEYENKHRDGYKNEYESIHKGEDDESHKDAYEGVYGGEYESSPKGVYEESHTNSYEEGTTSGHKVSHRDDLTQGPLGEYGGSSKGGYGGYQEDGNQERPIGNHGGSQEDVYESGFQGGGHKGANEGECKGKHSCGYVEISEGGGSASAGYEGGGQYEDSEEKGGGGGRSGYESIPTGGVGGRSSGNDDVPKEGGDGISGYGVLTNRGERGGSSGFGDIQKGGGGDSSEYGDSVRYVDSSKQVDSGGYEGSLRGSSDGQEYTGY